MAKEEPTKDDLKTQIEAAQAQPETVVEDPKPETAKHTYTASDGTVYEAETPDALLAKVAKARDDAATALKDRERQIFDLKQQVPAKKEETPVKEGAFDRGEYFKLMEEDPIKAQDYLDGFRPVFKDVQAVAQQQKIRSEVMGFYANVPEYAKVETPELNTALQARLKERGREYTKDNLALSFYELKNEGKVTAPAAPATERPKAPPPSAGGSGGNTGTPEPDLAMMSRAELAAYIRKQGGEVYTN